MAVNAVGSDSAVEIESLKGLIRRLSVNVGACLQLLGLKADLYKRPETPAKQGLQLTILIHSLFCKMSESGGNVNLRRPQTFCFVDNSETFSLLSQRREETRKIHIFGAAIREFVL